MAAIFPGAVATQLQLLTAQNNSMIVLDSDCDLDDDVITVDDASALPDSGYMTFVDTEEVIFYSAKTSNTLTGVTRGADGTAPASHLAGVDLEQRWNADYHNILTLEQVAVEQYLSDRFGITTHIIVPTGKAFTITDGLGIGGAVDSKSILSLTSTTKGFLPPVMTTTQRDAIASPTNGLVIYNSTTSALNVYRSSAWKNLLVPGLADIVNADIASGAAIAYSKLALTGSIVNADVNASAAIAYSKLALTGSIVNADVNASAAIAYSKLALTGTIVNADVHASAAIAYSKLNLATSIVNADINASAAIAYSKLNLATSILNADINASAAIALSKLAAVTASRVLVSDGSGFVSASSVTTTTLGYLDATSSIQTQLDARVLDTGDTMTGDLTMDNQKGIKFREGTGGGTNFAKIQAPATLSGDYTLTLPVDDGTSNQVLSTDGSGVLSWATVATGTNAPTNILDNGGFEIWQRGTSFSAPANGAYTADRWKLSTDEAANITETKETTTIDSVGLASLKVVVASAGASKYWKVYQYVENYADYRGKAITASVRVKSSVASAIKIQLYDGVNQPASSYHTGGGGWETLSVTMTVDAAATAIILYVGMLDAGDKQNGTYYWDSAMLVIGSTALDFLGLHPKEDLSRCQRFFVRIGGIGSFDPFGIAQCQSTTAAYLTIRLPVQMRVTPTLTINNATNFGMYTAGGSNNACTTVGASTLTSQCLMINANVASGQVAGNATVVYQTNANATIDVTADL